MGVWPPEGPSMTWLMVVACAVVDGRIRVGVPLAIGSWAWDLSLPSTDHSKSVFEESTKRTDSCDCDWTGNGSSAIGTILRWHWKH